MSKCFNFNTSLLLINPSYFQNW